MRRLAIGFLFLLCCCETAVGGLCCREQLHCLGNVSGCQCVTACVPVQGP